MVSKALAMHLGLDINKPLKKRKPKEKPKTQHQFSKNHISV